jgi:hypothetical protein
VRKIEASLSGKFAYISEPFNDGNNVNITRLNFIGDAEFNEIFSISKIAQKIKLGSTIFPI